MNKKNNPLSETCGCSEKLQELTKRINLLLRENQTLSCMLTFKDSALKNREEIICKMVHQNQSLLEENHLLKGKSKNVSSSPSILKQRTIRNEPKENKSFVKIFEAQPNRMTIPLIKQRRSSSTDLKLTRSNSSYQRNKESNTIRKITQFSGHFYNFLLKKIKTNSKKKKCILKKNPKNIIF